MNRLYSALPQGLLRLSRQRPSVFDLHAHNIRDALAVFQGAEDKVVLPNQSEVIVEKLRRQGVPFIYQLYEGEGHGFRKNETLLDYYQRVERFLVENVLFAP